MIEVGTRRRNQPPPPHVVFASLSEPEQDLSRPWLCLLDDERPPRVLEARPPSSITWSSLWVKRAIVRFDLVPDVRGGGTDLRWTLYVDEPSPAAPLLGHLRKRLNELINANLRYSYGQ